MPSFNDFSLQPTTRAILASMNITEPTPIQSQAIPALMAGSDLVGQSPTGSGKTLAYGIPLVERLSKDRRAVQALVLVPTRELAVQVNSVLSKLAASRRLTTALLVGGRPYGNQISSLRYGAQIVVGTPGRVKDHLERGSLVLSQLRVCVLDEADQMLDIGFAPIVEEILTTTPETRQMALFSATMPDWIVKLQEKFLKDPVTIDITASMGSQTTIEQIAYQVPHEQKMAALCTILNSTEGESSLIFGRTKFGVEKLGKQLTGLGFTVGTLHGDKSQRARDEVLTAFRHGHVQTLLATNVAARGLDISGIYQVINYELPESSELFTHRIGRTGRMGRQGKAITLLVPSDIPKWRRMARNLGQVVALQRLVINEETASTKPFVRPELSRTQEYTQNNEQRPARDRRPLNQERSRPAGSFNQEHNARYDSYAAPEGESKRNERVTRGAPVRVPTVQPESFPLPERPYVSKERDGEQGTNRSTGRSTGRRRTPSFAATEPRQRPGGRRPRPAAQATRRPATSNRAANR